MEYSSSSMVAESFWRSAAYSAGVWWMPSPLAWMQGASMAAEMARVAAAKMGAARKGAALLRDLKVRDYKEISETGD